MKVDIWLRLTLLAPLRYLFAAHPQAMGKVLGIICRAISTHLLHNSRTGLPVQ